MIKIKSLLPLFILSLMLMTACGGDVGNSNSNNGNSLVYVENDAANNDLNALGEAAAGQSAVNEPNDVVSELYKAHDAKKGPFYEQKRAAIDKYFAKSLADAIWKDEQRPNDQISALGADPLYDGQDFEIKNFAVGKATISGDKASVSATFQNFGEKKSVVFDLVMQGNDWKISDIKYDSGITLSSAYRANMVMPDKKEQDIGSISEFEGRYRVGDTFCTVTPVKMAFDIRWEKGKGVESFYFEGRSDKGINFAADTEDGKQNVFTFTDDNYNTGTFTRADGKVFPVSRAK